MGTRGGFWALILDIRLATDGHWLKLGPPLMTPDKQCGYLSGTITGISKTVPLSIAASLVQHTAAATHRYFTAIMHLAVLQRRDTVKTPTSAYHGPPEKRPHIPPLEPSSASLMAAIRLLLWSHRNPAVLAYTFACPQRRAASSLPEPRQLLAQTVL
ncbi:predicted protein [Histoplasma capsulatum var. duboisii H88]|uniref:Predicted protein n=2 Tax=Ajellomyces capsulatus TaxID=5037 RepID=F0U6K9_AJEC8|nr:predicted protein [Histoplasma capsulatum H143]EGC40648.1 predicted protein [Histoplasma capsulatum var. duboisii H88]